MTASHAMGGVSPPDTGERFVPVGTTTRPMRLTAVEHRRLARRYRRAGERTAWLFMAPMLVFFVAFLVVPVLQVFWWSTRDGAITVGSMPVGLDNYRRLPSQVDALASVRNTFVFALISIPLTLVLALAVSLLLSRVRRGGAAYRFFIYFPVLVPGVVAGLIWVFLTNYDFGLFNQILTALGAQPQVWLGSGSALYVLAVVDVWRSVGYWAIFFLAALQGLQQELYDAAETDGANAFQRFTRLTLPLLRRVILFAIVVATIWGLQVFDTALILTAGGPGTSTITIVFQVWTYIFGSQSGLGYGAAISVVLLVVILILTAIQLRLLRGRRGID
jgi:ABC-type sugar transport system permease subunit